MSELIQSERTQVRRRPQRGIYDRETVNRILDEGLVCHIGFLIDSSPFVIPTGYGRSGDRLLVHGSSASRMMRTLGEGAEACITVTLLDALVLAQSAFDHSMNYRSVVLMAKGERIEETGPKLEALEQISEHLIPGRWNEIRKPTPAELNATSVVSFPISEASAKIRVGPPSGDHEPYDRQVWTGLLPIQQSTGNAIADPGSSELELPQYLSSYRRG